MTNVSRITSGVLFQFQEQARGGVCKETRGDEKTCTRQSWQWWYQQDGGDLASRLVDRFPAGDLSSNPDFWADGNAGTDPAAAVLLMKGAVHVVRRGGPLGVRGVFGISSNNPGTKSKP